jgi:hypothetical protein
MLSIFAARDEKGKLQYNAQWLPVPVDIATRMQDQSMNDGKFGDFPTSREARRKKPQDFQARTSCTASVPALMILSPEEPQEQQQRLESQRSEPCALSSSRPICRETEA